MIALAIACRSAKPLPPPQAAAPPPSEIHGSVTAKLLADPSAPSVQLPPGETYVEPQIMRGNPMPEYPADLIPLKLPPHVVVLRITSNEESRIDDIRPSLLGGSTEDQYSTRFQQATEQAVAQWKVFPAEIRKMKDGPDLDGDGKPDYKIVTGRKILKAFFDIAFRFEMVDGKPVVRSEPPKGATVQ